MRGGAGGIDVEDVGLSGIRRALVVKPRSPDHHCVPRHGHPIAEVGLVLRGDPQRSEVFTHYVEKKCSPSPLHVAMVSTRRPDHHGVPADGHGIAETVIRRAVTGGQFGRLEPGVMVMG